MNIDELLASEGLPASYRQLVDELHVPLAAQIMAQLRSTAGCLTVGLCGAQGSGKSTMALVLAALLEEQGVGTAILSLDDLYLTRAERAQLGARIHPLLQTRGVPGTHDVSLGLQVMAALRQPGVVAIPSFDKSLDERRPAERWPQVNGPVQVIVFEGWCVGAIAQDRSSLAAPINALERDFDAEGVWRSYVNQCLAGEYRRLFSNIDLLILLKAPSFDVVYGWRLEQEHKLRQRIAAQGGDTSGVMSDVEVERFISHYERITRHILAEMPQRAQVVVSLDADRRPVAVARS